MNTVMMPWFMSSSWVPKFTGEDDGPPFSKWQPKVRSYLRAQGLDASQTVDFVLDALEGKAHRQVMLLPPERRQSEETILAELTKLYGDTRTSSSIRADFFACRQEQGEGVETFTLRLCECFSRWQRSSPDTTGPRDEVLKDHFVKGLREGPLKIELERHGRRNPTVTFGALCEEAEAVEKETTRRETLACRAYVAPTTTASHQGPIPPSEWDRLKEALHAELKQEIQTQVSLLGKTIVEDIRSQLQQEPALAPRSNYQPTRGGQPTGRETQSFQWDDQGRPLCAECGVAGHVQRYCPRRRSNRSGFPAPRPL